MIHSTWKGFVIAPPIGPILYGLIILFLPEITERHEFSLAMWGFSILFFSLASYAFCLILGYPLLSALKKLNMLTNSWLILFGSFLYTTSLYILLFHIMGGEIVGDKFSVIAHTLLVGFGLGIVVTSTFCAVAGIQTNKKNLPL